MIVLDPGEITRVVREPGEVQKERQAAAEAANRARAAEQQRKNEEKTRMKVGACVCWAGGMHALVGCGRPVLCGSACLPSIALAPIMQGKNKPSRRQRKKQANIIEERKPLVKARMREQGVSAEHGHKQQRAEAAVPEGVPRALHRFFKK
jgi:U3 small nucleolar RNA-associated protein 7